MRHDPILAILANMLRRVDGLAGQRGQVSLVSLRDEVDQIRHVARAYHIDSVECLADTLQSALSLQGTGPVILSYLDLMRDAIMSEMTEVSLPHPPVPTSSAACAPTFL